VLDGETGIMAKARREFYGVPAGSREQAFVTAAANSNLKAMKSLIAEGVNINAQPGGHSALHEAARMGLLKSAALLIAAHADLNLLDKEDMTPLMTACLAGKAKGSTIALMLLRAGADATVVRADDEMTALKFAAKRGTPEVLQALIDAGAQVDGPPGTEQTALMLAARANNVAALKVLVNNGADVALACKLPWAEGRTAEGLAELEKQRAALTYLRQIRGR
jgi:ankyrin repeat protein